ncbi:pr152.4 [rat cytomegalovirus strain Maastricht]|uniref:Pr152.4 n=1 Tax=Rat cytomegalovirus (strain Maastricht) TaxID=79700 RepID=Q9DW37_RCMVM|nr:pr152.4 [rat cytomegalovirus strain Maastricht]AAF99253.1 pr152.4 [rat cytomegalovirus strain Maastricht]WEG72073.1 membrane protein r159 [Murid betaherpesvirus 2]
MATHALTKIVLCVAVCTGLSTAWRCPDTMSLMANQTRNGSFETVTGFNSTFPFVKTVNGTVVQLAPFVNISRMWFELNFTAEQKTPLETLLNKHPNLTSAAIVYNCNVTTLNCTVACVFKGETTEGSREVNVSDAENGVHVCNDGYHLHRLMNHSHWLEGRWTHLCEYFVTLQFKEQNLAWMTLIGNETVECAFNTSIPIRYNITLYGYNLTRVDKECTQRDNQTVFCSITNSTRDIYNMSVLNCTIHRRPWPVWINAKFNYSEDELMTYEYDNPDYYYYKDGDYYEDEDEDEDEDEENEDEYNGNGEELINETTSKPNYAKQVKDPTNSDVVIPPGSVLLIIGIVALVAVTVLAVTFRKRRGGVREMANYQKRSRSLY